MKLFHCKIRQGLQGVIGSLWPWDTTEAESRELFSARGPFGAQTTIGFRIFRRA